MTYLWIPAIPIIVTLQSGRITAIEWNERVQQVLLVAEDWRVDVEWWRLRVWRDYYRLVTDRGYLIVIYQDLLDDTWYLQQLYD